MEFETLMLKDDKAAVAVSLTERSTRDLYTFWTKDNDWKIEAFKFMVAKFFTCITTDLKTWIVQV